MKVGRKLSTIQRLAGQRAMLNAFRNISYGLSWADKLDEDDKRAQKLVDEAASILYDKYRRLIGEE